MAGITSPLLWSVHGMLFNYQERVSSWERDGRVVRKECICAAGCRVTRLLCFVGHAGQRVSQREQTQKAKTSK